jgi:hypothetical protein
MHFSAKPDFAPIGEADFIIEVRGVEFLTVAIDSSPGYYRTLEALFA